MSSSAAQACDRSGTIAFTAHTDSGDLRVEGVVTAADGRSQAFVGWLAMLAAIEAVVADQSGEAVPPAEVPGAARG